MKRRGGVVQQLGAILRCPPTPEAVLAAVLVLREPKPQVLVIPRADLEQLITEAVRKVSEEQLLGTHEIAEALGIKPGTWTEWLRRHPELRELGVRSGGKGRLRFRLGEVEAVLQRLKPRRRVPP